MPSATSAPRPCASADHGFEPSPVDDLLSAQAGLIDRIQLAFGLDAATFASEVRPAITAYASFVHLLPATASDYFDRPGGLLALGLEVGFYALQGTDAHIFSGQATISTRRILEPRWRHATFLGGLCCELYRPLATLVVTDAEGNEWPAYQQPLATWLEAHRVSCYFVRWRPRATEARGLALFALPHIVAPATLQYLDEGHSVIVPHLLASIGGLPVYRELNVLDSLVRRSLALVVDRDLQANADRYGAPRFGSHLERCFVDALRRLPTPDDGSQGSNARSAMPGEPEPAIPPPQRLTLQAPMRLNPVVRDGLAAIIDTLNGDAQAAAACTVAGGIFVPLAELERRGVQPTLALRAIGDLHLLVHDTPDGPPTISRDFGGSRQIGLVLDPRCVAGLDLNAFVVPATEPG